jgi:large subunit ribosomal protein L10
MPMTKDQKAVVVEEISEILKENSTVYLTHYSGLTVKQANDLRTRFRKEGVEFKVLKNTLVRLAMERLGGYDEIYDHLNGPTGVAFSEEPAAPARVIKGFLKDNANLEMPQVRAAFIDGAVFAGSQQLDALASLKSKKELVGDIIGLLMSPATTVIGALQAQGGNIVGAIKTIAEREG